MESVAPVSLSLTNRPGTSLTRDIDKRLQRLAFSLPLPLPVRRALALAPSVWLFILFLCVSGWMFLRAARPEEVEVVIPRGMVEMMRGPEHVWEGGMVWVGREAYGHPVVEMIERAERAWEVERSRRPRNMEEFRQAYRAVSGGKEPSELYTTWSQSHTLPPPVPPPSLLMFGALHKTVLRRFQEEVEKLGGFYTIQIEEGKAIVFASPGESEEVWARAEEVNRLVNRFAKLLPDMRITLSSTPHPRQSLPHSALLSLSQAFASSRSLRITTPSTSPSPLLSCPPSPAPHPPIVPGLTFLFDPEKGMDPCTHPELVTFDQKWFDGAEGMVPHAGPMVGFVGGAGGTDVVMPLPGQVPMSRAEEADRWDAGVGGGEGERRGVPWDRREAKLFWRGRPLRHTTPSHPHPLHPLLHPSSAKQKVLVPRGRGFVWETMREPLKGLLDVELSPYEDWERERGGRRWVLDGGGEGEEYKLYDLLKTGGLVFRVSLYRTWASDQAKAWVHYVPVLPDLSDLPALLHFFQYHDDLGRKIAEAGQAWAEDQERREEVEGAWFTTFVEYANMYAKKGKAVHEHEQHGKYDMDIDGYVVAQD